STVSNSKATFYWDKNDLYLVNEESIGGIQIAFENGFKYTLNKELNSFETLKYQQDNEEMMVLFALNETELKPGKHKILTREASSNSLEITKAVLASKNGTPIDVDYYDIPLDIIKSPVQTDTMRIISYAPNPTDGPLDLYYYLPEDVIKLNVAVYDLSGNLVHYSDDLKNTSGYSHKELDLSTLKQGMYILSLFADSKSVMKYSKTIKIVIE
ncbi:MAG: T9SS type A sorting domain-containing protein, partial [Oceanospirillaceae bacterium]|nr:T9SS type A sorting domain-containing protein [Oceanospirillaceae bacterium]